MRVYTFRLPKVVSGFVRFCFSLVSKEEKSKKRNEKMPD